MQTGTWIVALLGLILAASTVAAGAEKHLTVHIVPHTHDDVGWLKTVDEYYIGTRNDIQNARVENIITSVMQSLEKDPRRKFIYVEIAFFWRWWTAQTAATKDKVRAFVKTGQLEFINGGWCMNDEAATYYQSIIDQMTLGHAFIRHEFDVVPTVGWHIDPFGHSSTQASLFKSMNFDAFMFGRIDFQDKEKRMADAEMEVMWQGSPSLGKTNALLATVLYNGYGPPDSFCFDIQCGDPDLQWRKDLFDYDLPQRMDYFAKQSRQWAEAYKGSNVIMTFGSDFQYEAAEVQFLNIDRMVDFFAQPENAHYNITVQYSTPSIYAKAQLNSGIDFTLKTDDFFPYADGPHAYWTGYYVSRAAFKAYVRYSNAHLQVCRQLGFASPAGSTQTPFVLEEPMGIAQHHDSVSGTAKQHVNNDYTKRLAMGCAGCDALISEALQSITGTKETFTRCEYLNLSICHGSEALQTLLVYNPHSRIHEAFPIRVPVITAAVVAVDVATGKEIPTQIVEIDEDTLHRARHNVDVPSKARYEAVFEVDIPALGFTAVRLEAKKEEIVVPEPVEEELVLENEFLKVEFDETTGEISRITDKKSGKAVNMRQTWEWYEGSAGTPEDGQASGAYIFRPNSSSTTPYGSGMVRTKRVSGAVVDEVWQTYEAGMVTQKYRMYKAQPFLELEYTLGPIDVSDNVGKEVITRFTTDVDSGDVWYTDANGREVLRRVRDFRPTWKVHLAEPVSGNYYPVNTRAFIRNDKADVQFTVVTDHSQGGSSLRSGELELMVNRRLTHDDGRGVGENLDEDIVVRGKMWISAGPIEGQNWFHRIVSEVLQHPMALFFSPAENVTAKATPVTLKQDLPRNVHLVTLLRLRGNEGYGILRLGHLFAEGESTDLSKPATVDVEKTMGLVIKEELSLSANQKLSEMAGFSLDGHANLESSIVEGNTIVLHPMEIRTYLVQLPKH